MHIRLFRVVPSVPRNETERNGMDKQMFRLGVSTSAERNGTERNSFGFMIFETERNKSCGTKYVFANLLRICCDECCGNDAPE